MEERREDAIRKSAGDLTYFGRLISPQTFYLPTPEFHKEVDEILMNRKNTQVLIEAPRGTSKSTKCVHFILHHAIFDRGDKVIVIQSKTRHEAIRRLTKVKEIIEYSNNFKETFGYFGEQAAISWREDYIKIRIGRHTITIIARGTGQQVRGILEGDTRITLYYLDDPDDEDNTKSKEGMDDNFSKFLGGVAGLDRRNGRVVIVGTPIVEGCIVARIRDSMGWITRVYESRTPDDHSGELLWGEMYNHEWLDNKKEELEKHGMLWKYYSEYMCQLKGRDDQVFKNEDFRYWDGEFELGKGEEHFILLKGIYNYDKEPIDIYDEPIRTPILTFLGIDPSFSLNPKADYSVSMPIAYNTKRDIYQLPYIRKRVLTSELVDIILHHHSIYRPSRTTIESGAQQDSVRQMVNLLGNKHIIGLGSKTPAPKDSKSKRYIDILQDYHRNHKLFLHLTKSQELKDEMIMHPSTTMHDDTIDALYWAVKRAYPADHTYREEKKDFIRLENRELSSKYNWML